MLGTPSSRALSHVSVNKTPTKSKPTVQPGSNQKAPLLPKNVVNSYEFVGDAIVLGSDTSTTPLKERIEMRKVEREEYLKTTMARDERGRTSNILLTQFNRELEKDTKLQTIEESESSEDEEGPISFSKQISLYTKLPPPNVQTLPFNFLTKHPDEPLTSTAEEGQLELNGLQTKEDFDKLKIKTNAFIDNLLNQVDDLYGKNPNEYVVYLSSRSKKGKNKKDLTKEQPTTIQFLKAIEKANDIMEEVDRSRKETFLKKKMISTHYSTKK